MAGSERLMPNKYDLKLTRNAAAGDARRLSAEHPAAWPGHGTEASRTAPAGG